ncbi:glycoside hydrolase family 3 C-terminal domain-containing protein [bacterium]|nr:glycoside hydrolase family 3 C-terminal domain-containing protein [bacterium]
MTLLDPSLTKIVLIINLFAVQCLLGVPTDQARIDALLEKMTLAEKVGQMSQYNLGSQDRDVSESDVRNGMVGSFLNAGDRESKQRLQQIAVDESRLGIPLIFGRDVIHGYRTIFPIPLAQSASWNPELVKAAAAVAAREAAQMGIHWTFSPMLDISRDPRWGRIAESPGEDPYLGTLMAKAMVEGYQGNNLDDPNTIAACAKHYVGYGAAEGGRDYNTTWIPEQYLRNVYLRPFKAAVEAGVATVMTGFNDLNGIPASANVFTLRQILRDEWKFNGFVVSDWTSMTEMILHGFCVDTADVALKSAIAGVDMEMVSHSYQMYLEQLVNEGAINIKLIDEMVANILGVKIKLGLFENPYPPAEDKQVLLHADHLSTARQLAAESMVLLKNEGQVLPIQPSVKRIAIIGPLADDGDAQIGTWAPDGRGEDAITPLAAFKVIESANLKIEYVAGLEHPRSTSTSGFRKAVKAVKKADLAFVFVGEDELLSGEAHNRAFLSLPGAQAELIAEIIKTKTPIVLVIMAGRPLTITEYISECEGVIYAWHPGTMGGPALVDLVTGKSQFTARLPVVLPRTVGQIPLYYAHMNTGRPATKDMLGIPQGTPQDPIAYLSYYLDADYTPLFDFGFGLTYSTFEYSKLELSSREMKSGETLTASCTLQNTGNSKAIETAQLYIRDRFGSLTRPVKELIGYQRIELNPGESTRVVFELSESDLAYWKQDLGFGAEAGEFHLMVGSSANDDDLLLSKFNLVTE